MRGEGLSSTLLAFGMTTRSFWMVAILERTSERARREEERVAPPSWVSPQTARSRVSSSSTPPLAIARARRIRLRLGREGAVHLLYERGEHERVAVAGKLDDGDRAVVVADDLNRLVIKNAHSRAQDQGEWRRGLGDRKTTRDRRTFEPRIAGPEYRAPFGRPAGARIVGPSVSHRALRCWSAIVGGRRRLHFDVWRSAY